MSEEMARILLSEAADGEATPPPPELAALLARARIEQRRTRGMLAMAAVLAASLTAGILAIQLEVGDPRRPVFAAPSAAQRVSHAPAPSQEPLPSASPQPTAPPWPGDQPGNPHCGWKDTLPPTVMSTLPVAGTWGSPAQVGGICGPTVATQITVAEAGKTGLVSVVISKTDPGSVKQQVCVTAGQHCERISNGYLFWEDFQDTLRGDSGVVYMAHARLGITGGQFIEVNCGSRAYDRDGYDLGLPRMDHAPCTGQQAADLARQLVKTHWLQ